MNEFLRNSLEVLQIISPTLLFLCVVFLAFMCIYRGGRIIRLRRQLRLVYRRGLLRGELRGIRKEHLRRMRELQDAKRRSVPREDAGSAARVSRIRIASSKDPEN